MINVKAVWPSVDLKTPVGREKFGCMFVPPEALLQYFCVAF